jgi:hypothetical protein
MKKFPDKSLVNDLLAEEGTLCGVMQQLCSIAVAAKCTYAAILSCGSVRLSLAW